MYQVSYLNGDGQRVLAQADFPNYYDAIRYARTVHCERMPQVLRVQAITDYIHGPAAKWLADNMASQPPWTPQDH